MSQSQNSLFQDLQNKVTNVVAIDSKWIIPPQGPHRWSRPGSLDRLKASLDHFGQLSAITVIQESPLRYRIFDGVGRYLAGQELNVLEYEAQIVTKIDPAKGFLITNTIRQPLDPITLARSLLRVKTQDVLSNVELGNLIGCPRTTLTQTLSIATLPEEILDEALKMNPQPSRDALISVARCKDPIERLALWVMVKAGKKRSELRQVTRSNVGYSRGFRSLIKQTRKNVRALADCLNSDATPLQQRPHIAAIGALYSASFGLLEAIEQWHGPASGIEVHRQASAGGRGAPDQSTGGAP